MSNSPVKEKHERLIEVVIHIACWLFILAMPFFGALRSEDSITFPWPRYLHHCLVVFLCACIVYVNYFYLLPKLFLAQKHKTIYWLINVVLILSFAFILQIHKEPRIDDLQEPKPIESLEQGQLDDPMHIDEQSLPDQQPNGHHAHHHHPPMFIFYMRDMSFLCLAFIIAFAVKMGLYYRRKELHYQQLEKAQIETELQNLRYQINPHFLLNTLNNIYALIDIDPAKAQISILELSKMLRYVLYDNKPYVPLSHEVLFLQNYIDLMRLRLASNVVVSTEFDVDENCATEVAPMLFIALVENAFKHGVSPKQKCAISIQLSETDGIVTCVVSNCNHPKTDKDKSGSGVGLAQLRRRLDLIYPSNYDWNITLSEDKKIYTSKLTINTKV